MSDSLPIIDLRLSRPDSKAGQLQRHALALLLAREGDPDGLPTSVRFLYYQLVDESVLSKHRPEDADRGGRRSDQDLQDAVMHLREKGIVPWDWISDETRSLFQPYAASSVTEWQLGMVDAARLDPWNGALPPFLLTESRSLSGVLARTARLYCVPLAATNGQVGGFLRTVVAPALTPGQRVLYLGDYDLCGGQIEANTRRVLERLRGPLDWQRIAITSEQIAAYDLVVKFKTDRRYKDGRPHEAVETEALGQERIVRLVRATLDAMLPEPLEDVLEREEAERGPVRDALRRMMRRKPRPLTQPPRPGGRESS